jgi:hypothetical protein
MIAVATPGSTPAARGEKPPFARRKRRLLKGDDHVQCNRRTTKDSEVRETGCEAVHTLL